MKNVTDFSKDELIKSIQDDNRTLNDLGQELGEKSKEVELLTNKREDIKTKREVKMKHLRKLLGEEVV